MVKPVLVIMAAGLGSRYGGLKQIDPIDDQGHIIIDYSIYDAKCAGFEKVIFIIKKEFEMDFRETIGKRIEHMIEVVYVYQDIGNLPSGFEIPAGREKPWGTAQAVLSCIAQIDGPFAVINADDYYGRNAFKTLYDYLSANRDDEKYHYTMLGYFLENTVTDNGHVARGVCEMNDQGNLVNIREITRIEKNAKGIAYTEDGGESWVQIPGNSLVSMNMWGFTKSILPEIEAGFPKFLEEEVKTNPLKCEYFLPSVVSGLIESEKAKVDVLISNEQWYGVTYVEDKPTVMKAIAEMKENGLYPKKLWER